MDLLEIAQYERTSNPILSAIYLARQINRQAGGVIVAPWDVAQLPEVWLDAFASLDQDLGKLRANLLDFDKYVTAWRQKALQRH